MADTENSPQAAPQQDASPPPYDRRQRREEIREDVMRQVEEEAQRHMECVTTNLQTKAQAIRQEHGLPERFVEDLRQAHLLYDVQFLQFATKSFDPSQAKSFGQVLRERVQGAYEINDTAMEAARAASAAGTAANEAMECRIGQPEASLENLPSPGATPAMPKGKGAQRSV